MLSAPITFETSGGDAFRQDKVTVRRDGGVRVETRSGDRSSKLTADELSEYRGRKVETDAGAMPERLAPLVRMFLELIDAHGP